MNKTAEQGEKAASENGKDSGFRSVAKETLSPGAAKLLDALQELGVGVAGLADEAAQRMRETLATGTETVGERAAHATQATREKAGDVLRQTETFIRERPFTALGIAFLAGYLLSSRR
jgi:ElaB/YqjD/DUF883 family membrane-anchored ribosome-binding protein